MEPFEQKAIKGPKLTSVKNSNRATKAPISIYKSEQPECKKMF